MVELHRPGIVVQLESVGGVRQGGKLGLGHESAPFGPRHRRLLEPSPRFLSQLQLAEIEFEFGALFV